MSETAIEYALGKGRLWKGKYKVDWCVLCECVIFICPDCENISCSGMGCAKCKDNPSNSVKVRIESYLTPEEISVYRKISRLKKHMIDSIMDGEHEIDFAKRDKAGKFSRTEKEIFKDFIDLPCPKG